MAVIQGSAQTFRNNEGPATSRFELQEMVEDRRWRITTGASFSDIGREGLTAAQCFQIWKLTPRYEHHVNTG